MLNLLDGFPGNVIAIAAVGRVTREDYETILIPRVTAAARRYPALRLYYEIGSEFAGIEPGAAWDDFRLGVEYWSRWEKVVAVTDVPWISHLVNAFRFLMPGQVRVFPLAETAAARAWIVA